MVGSGTWGPQKAGISLAPHLFAPAWILGPGTTQIPASGTGRSRGRNDSTSVLATVNSLTVFIVKKLQLEDGTLKTHNH